MSSFCSDGRKITDIASSPSLPVAAAGGASRRKETASSAQSGAAYNRGLSGKTIVARKVGKANDSNAVTSTVYLPTLGVPCPTRARGDLEGPEWL
eukprot:1252928-Amphidinium_carterae.1